MIPFFTICIKDGVGGVPVQLLIRADKFVLVQREGKRVTLCVDGAVSPVWFNLPTLEEAESLFVRISNELTKTP